MKKVTKKVIKKEAKKPVKRVAPKPKKTSPAKEEQAQSVKYWRSRPITDEDRDWGYGTESWVKDYVASIAHPHRAKIIDILSTFDWSYLLEVGCCTGPNLQLIRENWSDRALFGIEPNEDAVEEAKASIASNIKVQIGDYYSLPFSDGYFDVVLADATLMYASDKDIDKALDEIDRVTKKAILIVDRFTEKDSTESHVWSRNYPKYLSDRGYMVKEWKVTESEWGTSKNWVKYGRYWLGLK